MTSRDCPPAGRAIKHCASEASNLVRLTRASLAALAILRVSAIGVAQVGPRRLTTIDALRQFPGYFHLQNVLLRGESAEAERRVVLRADENELGVQLADGVTT